MTNDIFQHITKLSNTKNNKRQNKKNTFIKKIKAFQNFYETLNPSMQPTIIWEKLRMFKLGFSNITRNHMHNTAMKDLNYNFPPLNFLTGLSIFTNKILKFCLE